MPTLAQVSEMPMPSRPYMAASDSAEKTMNQSIRTIPGRVLEDEGVAGVLLELAGVHAEHAGRRGRG